MSMTGMETSIATCCGPPVPRADPGFNGPLMLDLTDNSHVTGAAQKPARHHRHASVTERGDPPGQ
jgi:hypothetical protein